MDLEPRSPLGYLGQPLTVTQQRFLALQIVLIVLATIAVGLRLYARNLIKARLWWDDYTIIFAWVNIHIRDHDRKVQQSLQSSRCSAWLNSVKLWHLFQRVLLLPMHTRESRHSCWSVRGSDL